MLPTHKSFLNMCNNTTSRNIPPKIHINPNFCLANNMPQPQPMQVAEERIQPHINPMFLYRQTPKKIYMNPNFFPIPITNAFAEIHATSYNATTMAVEKRHTSTTTTTVLADTTTRVNRYKLDKRERPMKLPASMSQPKNLNKTSSYKPSLNKKLQTLNINGVMYQSTGRKLQRKDSSGIVPMKRWTKQLNIRSHVNNAKQRSLQVLRQKLVKSNIPCPIFRRLGRCRALEAKKCNKVHDNKYVVICRK